MTVSDELVEKVNTVGSSKLVKKKLNFDTNIKEMEEKTPDHDKYITTPEFNKLAKENFDETLKESKFSKQK